MKFGITVVLSSRDAYLKGTMKFYSYFLEIRMIYIKFITQNLHVVPLNICTFSENLCSENRTLVKGVNENLPVIVTIFVRFG
jgi:hypothetical protein